MDLIFKIISYFDLILIIIGTIGNSFTFIILIRKNLIKYSYCKYLSVLCLADIVCLYTWNLSNIYRDLFSKTEIRFEHENEILCRIFAFTSYCSLQTSSWLLATISFDRLSRIISKGSKIKNASKMTTNKIAYILTKHSPFKHTCRVIIVIIFAVICFNLVVIVHNAVPSTDDENNTLTLNTVNVSVNILESMNMSFNQTLFQYPISFNTEITLLCYTPSYFYIIWDIVHLMFYSIIPFVLILIINIYIFMVAYKSSMRILKYQNNVVRNAQHRQQRLHFKISKLLILLTISFGLTTVPYTFLYAIRKVTGNRSFELNVMRRLLSSLQYMGHALNFLIYIYSSSNMRREIRVLFTKLEIILLNFKRNLAY